MNNTVDNTLGARRHLDQAGTAYLEAINGVNLEALQRYREELRLLTDNLNDPKYVVSVGVGNGIEPHVLRLQTNATVIGIDLSSPPLKVARKHSMAYNIPVSYLQGSGIELPLLSSSVDAVSLSSILHEVYSYVPNGLLSLLKAVHEAVRVIRPGGMLYIKDFAAGHDPNRVMMLTFKDQFALDFYDFWQRHYRKFESWTNEDKKLVLTNADVLSYPVRIDNSVMIKSGLIGEFLMHLRNAFNDYGKNNFELSEDGAILWKEMNEQYHISVDGEVLSPEWYEQMLIRSTRIAFKNQRALVTQERHIVPRETNARGLQTLVDVYDGDYSEESSIAHITNLTRKMLFVFKVL